MGIFKKKFNKRDFLQLSSFVVDDKFIFNHNFWDTADDCIDLIASTFASLPIAIYRKTANGREKVTTHPLSLVLKKPNAEETNFIFWYYIIDDYYRHGNAYIKPYYNNDHELVAIYRLPASQVKVERNEEGQKIFIFNNKIYSNKQILHIPSRFGYDGLTGLSIFNKKKKVFELADILYNFFIKSYSNGMLGSKRMLVDLSELLDNPHLTLDEIETIKAKFINEYTGVQNIEKPILKTLKDVKYEAIDTGGISNREAQLNESLQIIDNMICKVFHVPYEFIIGKNSYNSLEQTTQVLLDFAVRPIAQSIIESLTKLITINEMDHLYIEPNYNALLRLNYTDRVNGYSKLLGSGVLTINEVRNMENLPGLGEEGDIAMIPANLLPLTMDVINSRLASQKAILSEIDKNIEKTGEY